MTPALRFVSTVRCNRDDCLSTWKLHAWLVERRPPDLAWASPPEAWEASEQSQQRNAAVQAAQERLHAQDEHLLADLLDFHRRDAKPEWWEYFRRLTLDERGLIEDTAAIGGIEHDASVEPYPLKKSLVWELTFPAQEFKVGAGAIDPETEEAPGEIVSIDEVGGRIKLKRGKSKWENPLPRALWGRFRPFGGGFRA